MAPWFLFNGMYVVFKNKDALCKLDGVLVSIQYKSKHIFYTDFTIKSIECCFATQDIECHEVKKYS